MRNNGCSLAVSSRMQATPDLSSSRERPANDCLTSSNTSNACCERTLSLVRDSNTVADEREDCDGLPDDLRGSRLCASTPDDVQPLFQYSVPDIHQKRMTDGCSRGGIVKNGCGNRKHVQNNDAPFVSSSSDSNLQLCTDKRHRRLQVQHNKMFNYYSSTEQIDNLSEAHSNILGRISNKKNKPPVVCTHFHHKRTLLYTFTNFLFITCLLASMISPSLSSSSSLASSSPNLLSWRLAALETVDVRTKQDELSSRIPIPDVTAVVGRLFQFKIPDSAFSGEVSQFKVCLFFFVL